MIKKITILVLVFTCFAGGVLFAQEEVDTIDPALINPDTAQQKLQEISVSKFEDAGDWYGYIPSDFGLIFTRGFAGGPNDREPLQEEIDAGIIEVDGDGRIIRGDISVLGVKVMFYRRGIVEFNVRPARPIPIPGKVKVITVWVCGRESQHDLDVIVADYFGNIAYVPMGTLDFPGWSKMSAVMPANLRQRDTHYSYLGGVTVRGFQINCDLDETYGNFFIYFDDMRAITDLFDEELRSEDDMLDAW
jgi:hypothetical protein